MAQYGSNSGMIDIDPRSGFCKSNSVFYSKRKPMAFPPNQDLDLPTFISSRAHHGTIAFIDAATGQRLTFSDLWTAVDSVATCLHDDLGIRKGHVVLLLSPNSIFFPVVCLSVMSLGAVITTTNPLNTTREIAMQIYDSNPVLAFTTPQLLPKLADSNLPVVLMNGPAHETTSLPAPAPASPPKVKIASTLEQMMSKQPSGRSRVRDRVNQEDTASLLYSSGTTGASKGVVSSHKSLISIVQTIVRWFSRNGQQIFLCTVPMFHIYGFVTFTAATITLGSTVVVLPKFDIDEMLSSIDKYRVTNLSLVPPILVALFNGADRIKAKYDLSSLQTVVSGGAPLSKEVIEGFVEKYPTLEIFQGYGLTENTGLGACTASLEESRRYGTAGLLTPNVEAKIVDPKSGTALPVNRTSELWLRSPAVMKGYFNNVEATTSTIDADGWLKTGDLCYIDEDGYLFVVDRLKELIKYKAYQVPPAELEALLLTHPEIADASVIPFPDKDVGQFPMAYVVRKSNSNLSEREVMDFVAKQVAPYKRVRRVAFIASIPKNPSGKILRKDLIQLATSKL